MKLSQRIRERLQQMKGEYSAKDEKMAQAIVCYFKRLRLQEDPEGDKRFGFWFPSKDEQRYCCNVIFKRGLKSEKDLWNHCRSHIHIAFRYGISSAQLLYEVRKAAEEEQIDAMLEEELAREGV